MLEYLFKYKVPDFQKHKENIINLINKIPVNYLRDNTQSISHTDWSLPQTMKRDYLDYLNNNIMSPFYKDIIKKLNFKKIEVICLWFQVYKKNDFHKKHNHGSCSFTNIFYIKLPQNTKTNIYDLKGDKINFEVSEGDIITFPSFFYHESPINLNDENKIIISFNSNLG